MGPFFGVSEKLCKTFELVKIVGEATLFVVSCDGGIEHH